MTSDTNDPALKDEDAPFDVQYQNAIFQFLFLLIDTYAREMPYDQATIKACDWLTSLATDIRKKSIDIAQKNKDVYRQFKQAQK